MLGHRIGYLASGSYSYSQEVRRNEFRALARPGEGGTQVEYNRFAGTTGRQSAMLGGLLNVSTLIGTGSRVALNNTYSRTSDNDARTESGLYEDFGNVPLTIQRLDYVERSILSSQFLGEHRAGRNGIDWSVTGSRVTRDQPDRSEYVFEQSGGSQLWVNTLTEGAVRTFGQLDEGSVEAMFNGERRLGDGGAQVLKVGVLGRTTRRDADTRSYSIYAPVLSDELRALPPEELFATQTQQSSGVLSIRSLAQGGSYTAHDELLAGYAMADVGFGEMVRVIGGARVEQSSVEVSAVNTLGEPATSNSTFTDVLPAFALTVMPTPTQNVRFSVSRTLARPEYRELAGIRTRDVLGGVDLRGNPDLERTLIDNADLRWELYPAPGEVVSVAVFAKRFARPIERVFRPSSTNSLIELVNAESARNLGVEIDLRKGLAFIAEPLREFTVASNATVMQSEIRLGESAAGSTVATRAMVGQAPWVVNGSLTWAPLRRTGVSATLLFNAVGERIVNAGELPLPDVVEVPRSMLDFSFQVPVRGSLAVRLDARNLLDAAHEIRQGDVTREYHESGRSFQVGVNWR